MNQRGGILRPLEAVFQGFVAALACGSLNPISSGVFFTNTTSFPRDKKLLYTDVPAPHAANAMDTGCDLAGGEITVPVIPEPETPAPARTLGSPAASVVPCSVSG